MNSKKNNRKPPLNIQEEVDENAFQDLLTYLKQRIHRPAYNVFAQYHKKLSGQEYNWWKENQMLI